MHNLGTGNQDWTEGSIYIYDTSSPFSGLQTVLIHFFSGVSVRITPKAVVISAENFLFFGGGGGGGKEKKRARVGFPVGKDRGGYSWLSFSDVAMGEASINTGRESQRSQTC